MQQKTENRIFVLEQQVADLRKRLAATETLLAAQAEKTPRAAIY